MENDIVFYFLLWVDRKGDKFNVYFKFKDWLNVIYYDYKIMMLYDLIDFFGY